MSLALLFAAVAAPASAQIVQSVAFGAGFFQPRGFDRRVDGDTLVANLTQPVIPGYEPNTGSLSFDIGEFRGMPLFGEWNLGINKHIEFSAGLSYFTNKVDSVYLDLVNGQQNNSEIEQELRLTMIPISGLVRFFPTAIRPGSSRTLAAASRSSRSAIPRRETSSTSNTPGLDIYNAKYTGEGNRVRSGHPRWRPVSARRRRLRLTVEGKVSVRERQDCGAAAGFLGDKIDLSGGTIQGGFLIRF
jgi:hypothetical protein